MTDGSWQNQSACKDYDPEFFFPDTGAGKATYTTAKAICRGVCKVRNECLTFAIENREISRYGMWGGLTPNQLSALVGHRARVC